MQEPAHLPLPLFSTVFWMVLLCLLKWHLMEIVPLAHEPFCRTQPSTLNDMKHASDLKPKDIIRNTYEKVGGMMNTSSYSQVGRNLKQVFNMK